MSVKLTSISREIIPDELPDVSYLQQDVFSERLKQYERGDLTFIGIKEMARIEIKMSENHYITQEILSPGLWSIESDATDDYLESVYQTEIEILKSMLKELSVEGV